MRIALAVLLVVHAAVHVLGFVAAVSHSRADGAAASSRRGFSGPAGWALAGVWLAAVVAFATGAAGLFADAAWWRTAGFLGVIASAVAVALWWRDAKYGVPLTAVVLAAVLAAPGIDALP